MPLDLLSFVFTVVTTVLLGVLAVVQYVGERARRRFEDTQLALDIVASLSTAEIIALLDRQPVQTTDREYLRQAHRVATERLDAMTSFPQLKREVQDPVNAALERVLTAIGDNEAVELQQRVNDRVGSSGGVDRSRFSWQGKGRYSKQELLHLIGLRFIETERIRTRDDFESQFGAVLQGVLGPEVKGKPFRPSRLLDELAAPGSRLHKHDRELAAEHGAIELDGGSYRVAWNLGYPGVSDLGRVVQLPVIHHFRALPGYEITEL